MRLGDGALELEKEQPVPWSSEWGTQSRHLLALLRMVTLLLFSLCTGHVGHLNVLASQMAFTARAYTEQLVHSYLLLSGHRDNAPRGPK